MAGKPGRRRGIGAIVLLVLGVALAAGPYAYMSGRFTPMKQPSDNMLPTITAGTVLAVEKEPGEIRRGDVVVYDPAGWGYEGPFIGRVVALGGDHIAYARGDRALTLNGKPLDEPYLRDGDPGAGGVAFAVSVPQGRMFVLGDNRGNSQDSRFHPESDAGTLPLSAVVGVDAGLDQEAPLVMALGTVSLAGVVLLLTGLGLGIASLAARRRPAEAYGPARSGTRADAP
ncbi:signal peptidase I [Streptomyces erythrochromogenes]|uniref:signal peptidase I n=1 Tax=Streptomyces erythrochromogenes TaxID=285574 RepID=UPI0033F76E26